MIASKFGKVLVAVRDAESRTRFLGYRVEHYKLFVFVVSAMHGRHCRRSLRAAGRHHQPGRIRARQLHRGGHLGGRRRPRTLVGPIVGAILVNGAKSWFTAPFPDWLYALGGLFVAVTMFLPRGVVGTLRAWSARAAPPRRRTRRRRPILHTRRGVSAMTDRRESLLYLDDVSVSFDGFKAINALSLVIEPGELRAIIGPNGAGKTTMMDIITGKTRPDEGDVYFNGKIDLTQQDEADIASSASAANSRSRRSSKATRSRTISSSPSRASAVSSPPLFATAHQRHGDAHR